MGYFVEVAVEQIIFGAVVGLLIGIVGGKIISKARENSWITPEYQRIAYLCLALMNFFVADEIGGSGFIAAFIGGLSLGYVIKDAGDMLIDFSEAEGQLLNLAVFFLLGIVILPIIPLITWQVVVYAVLSLTVIRMIPVALSLIGTKQSLDSILFIGWFGPRGLCINCACTLGHIRIGCFSRGHHLYFGGFRHSTPECFCPWIISIPTLKSLRPKNQKEIKLNGWCGC